MTPEEEVRYYGAIMLANQDVVAQSSSACPLLWVPLVIAPASSDAGLDAPLVDEDR